jgi:hypothetical protein
MEAVISKFSGYFESISKFLRFSKNIDNLDPLQGKNHFQNLPLTQIT